MEAQITHRQTTLLPMAIIGLLFFVFGFVTWLNGALIPFLQIACELNNTQAYLVTLAFYISYTVMALPMSVILKRTGYKNGMVIGLAIMVVGALLFVPAALTRLYAVFLLALFVLGAGLTLLQTASNPFVVVLGPIESAAVRISIMGILNKAAGVLAPLVFTAFVLQGMDQYSAEALATLSDDARQQQLSLLSARLTEPYLLMAAVLAGLAVFLKFSPLNDPPNQEMNSGGEGASILSHPQLVLGAVTLFFYVGAEVIAGDTIGLFGRSLGVANFGALTAYTMGFMVVGYIIGILVIPRWISQSQALVASALLGIALTLLLVTADASSNSLTQTLSSASSEPSAPNVILFVALFGLANALVWPAVWPLALSDLNPRQVGTGSALLIMGIAGGAILPMCYGALADTNLGEQAAYWIMLPCYLFILFYALKGSRLRKW